VPAPFGERLAAAVAARESQIVLGIDPDPARLWPDAAARAPGARAALGPLPSGIETEAAAAVLAHCRALIDAAGPACVAAKPQLACFERLGTAGRRALELTCEHARAAGLLVLADAKRGDVPVTARAYAQSLTGVTPTPFGEVPGLGADALTATPLLGRDTTGLADVGAVTGATVPRHLERMRELMPRTPFLLPGVGAQGGDVAALAPAFAPGRAAGLVTASRSIADAGETTGAEPAGAARAEAERLRATAWSLA
jgi:orotidine-5'-phosphate decarboxylase